MELAYELELPVIVHCRDAANEMIKTFNDSLTKENVLKGYFIAGQARQKNSFLDLGFYISFSGIVTFPKHMKYMSVPKLLMTNT